MKLQGIFVSAATPFDYSGALYKTKVQHNVEKWNRTSVAGYVFAGTAGEGSLLADDEKAALWELGSRHADSGKLLIAAVTSDGVHLCAGLARRAADLGFHAVLCGVPMHHRNLMNHPAAQMLHFRAVADRSPVPVVIENAPQETGIDISPETSAALAAHPNIAGIVEVGTPPARVTRIRESAGDPFPVLAGSSSSLWESLTLGGVGAVLSLASAVPYACITLWEAFRTRETEAGQDWQNRIALPSILVSDKYGPPGLKYAMELNGYYGGPPRLPYCPPSASARLEIEAAFAGLRG